MDKFRDAVSPKSELSNTTNESTTTAPLSSNSAELIPIAQQQPQQQLQEPIKEENRGLFRFLPRTLPTQYVIAFALPIIVLLLHLYFRPGYILIRVKKCDYFDISYDKTLKATIIWTLIGWVILYMFTY